MSVKNHFKTLVNGIVNTNENILGLIAKLERVKLGLLI